MFQDHKDKSYFYLKICTRLVQDDSKLLDDNGKVP